MLFLQNMWIHSLIYSSMRQLVEHIPLGSGTRPVRVYIVILTVKGLIRPLSGAVLQPVEVVMLLLRLQVHTLPILHQGLRYMVIQRIVPQEQPIASTAVTAIPLI